MTLSEYEQLVSQQLSATRMQHSRNVAKEAERLAKRYGADPQKARLAGILHDIMKEAPPQQQLKIIEGSGIMLTDVERGAPKLWHAMAGAIYIRDTLKLADDEIIDAVRYHTTGRVNMTPLEKVVFVADFTSEERDYDGVEELRTAADTSLEAAMLAGMVYTIADLAEKQRPIHPDSLSAYNQIVLSLQL